MLFGLLLLLLLLFLSVIQQHCVTKNNNLQRQTQSERVSVQECKREKEEKGRQTLNERII